MWVLSPFHELESYLNLGDRQDENDEREEDDEGNWHDDHESIESPAAEISHVLLAAWPYLLHGGLWF